MKPVPLVALLALAACAPLAPTASPRGASPGPTAGFGELARAGKVIVRPLELLEDSRCPASVQCVWAGQVRIRAEIIAETGSEVRELTLGQPISIFGGRFRLVEVEPGKVTPATIERSRYWFAFDFVR